MDGDKINSAVTSNQQKLMEIIAEPAAEAFLGLTKHFSTPIIAGSKLHESLMAIRNIPLESVGKDHVDAGVQADVKPKVESQMNSKEANEWLEIAITALSANDHQRAEQFLKKFNNLCLSNQVKLILDKIQLNISHMSEYKKSEEKSPDMFIVDKFLDIAKKAIAAKDLQKAEDILNKAKKVKPTETVQKLLDSVKQDIEKQQTAAGDIMIEYALTAIDEDDYDVAEMLLKTAWIKYKSQLSKKMLESFMNNIENVSITKQIVNKTNYQLRFIALKHLMKAQKLISDGKQEIAESLLIIASHTYNADHSDYIYGDSIDQLLVKISSTLYPNTVHPKHNWNIGKPSKYTKNSYDRFEGSYADDVQTYKCAYYLTMANRSYLCAGNSKLAMDFLNEAITLCPSGYDVNRYIKVIESKQRTCPLTHA